MGLLSRRESAKNAQKHVKKRAKTTKKRVKFAKKQQKATLLANNRFLETSTTGSYACRRD